jgi:hypothetical protein
LPHPNHDDSNQSDTVGNHDGDRHPHHYNPNQPRVPAGHHDGGQWTGGGSADQGKMQLAFVGDPRRFAIQFIVQKAIEAGLAAYSALSAYNSRHHRTVLEVKARGYFREGAPGGEFNQTRPRILTQQQVTDVCGKLKTVQEITDEAVKKVKAEGKSMSPTQYGTEIHKRVASAIGKNDPNLKAEISYVKMAEEGVNMEEERKKMQEHGVDYGTKGSIRVDILEKIGENTVCVYDIKTGNAGLSFARFAEIFANVRSVYSDATSIVITEVRPTDPWRPNPN